MKKVILLLQSLSDKSFTMLKEHIKAMSSDDYCFCIFHSFELSVNIGGFNTNYEIFRQILKDKGFHTLTLEEYSIDEYFCGHCNGDIYLTPTESVPTVISSAALLGYKGNIYVFASSKNEPPVSNITSCIRAFKYNDIAGIKGLNKAKISYDHSKGNACYYTIDGIKYSQSLKEKSGCKSGVQGYTMACEGYPGYRIKIWDSFLPKYQYEIDEVAAMISDKLAHPSIAFPITFVYNEKDEPIGFVMRNFNGYELNIHAMHRRDDALKICEQILKIVIWMEANSIFHRDISHNMLIDKDGNVSVIDVDSLQYKAFPATASESDPPNALPRKYFSSSLFYNTIDISYTTLAFIVSGFYDIESFFGVWDESGLCPIKNNLLYELNRIHPSIAHIITEAYINGKPVSPVRQLEAIQKALSEKSEACVEYDCVGDLEEPDLLYGDCPAFDRETYDDEVSSSPDAAVSEIFQKSKKDDKNSFRKYNHSVNVIDGNTPNKALDNLIWFFKKLILSVFSTGTIVHGMTKEDEWKEFIRSKKWVKPLISTSLAVVLIIVMIIAIIIM